MKIIFLIILFVVFIRNDLSAQGITKNGQSTNSSPDFVNRNGKIVEVQNINKNGCILSLATLTTTSISSLTFTTASGGGNISRDGGLPITTRGICWNTSTGPTIANNLTVNGSGIGVFTSTLSGLATGTTYYVRAYATNSIGTAYGTELSFIPGIGMSYQGGIVAYILGPSDPGYIAGETHGLIAAPSDQGTTPQWGCVGSVISGADGYGLGTGNQNTIDIMAGCSTAGIAARICGDLVLGGYSDWYLPSKDELYKLYLNKTAIGGFAFGEYWSSTEEPEPWTNYAYILHFGSAGSYGGYKSYNYHVRAIRSF